MRKDKELVFKLRKEGKSYREIQKEVGISRATLTAWFRNLSWSKHLSEEHRKKNLGATTERMIRMNMARKLSLQWKYALAEKEASEAYNQHRTDPLFWAGLMIYAGEGDKRSKGLIRISNTEFYLHRIFISFAEKYLGVKKSEFRCALILYPDLDETTCKNAWMKELSIGLDVFHKTQVIKGKQAKKRLQYGVGMSIISNTSLKKKLLKWLTLAEGETFENAGMVQG